MRNFIREQTHQRFRKLNKELRRLRRAPHDEEALHDFRVANRRFVQCLRTFEDSFDKGDSKKLRRKLRNMMHHCGDVRDRDIAIRLLAEAGVRDADLVVQLAADRVKQQKKLIAELERWRGKRGLTHWRKRLKVRRTPGSHVDFAALQLPRMEDEWLEAGDKAVKSESYQTLHRFRIVSKRFRYTLEMFDDVASTEQKRRLEQIKKLQDHLGGINDCVATRQLMRGHAQAKRALGDVLKAREREFHAFWKKLKETKRDGTLHIAPRRSGAA